MDLIRCKKGHYYDGDKYAGCPHCAQKDIVAKNTIRISENIDKEETERKQTVSQSGKALKDAVLDALEHKRESEVRQVRTQKNISNEKFPVGILIVINGKQMGKMYSLESGYNYIGLIDDCIDITKDVEAKSGECAVISYHEERNLFILKPCGEEPMVQVGRMILKDSIMLKAYDKIIIRQETLLFIPICGEHFTWK